MGLWSIIACDDGCPRAGPVINGGVLIDHSRLILSSLSGQHCHNNEHFLCIRLFTQTRNFYPLMITHCSLVRASSVALWEKFHKKIVFHATLEYFNAFYGVFTSKLDFELKHSNSFEVFTFISSKRIDTSDLYILIFCFRT